MAPASPRLLRQGYEDFRDFVNPLISLRAELTGEPYQVSEVRDGRLVDLDGREVEDFLSGWGTQAFGHRNPAVTRALTELLASPVPSFFTSGVSPYAGLLARRLCERTGGAYDAAWFASGGSEAVEAALKLARARSGRPRILHLEGAYHGCTMGAAAMMHHGPYRDPFAPHLPSVEALPFGDVAALRAALGSGDVAAVVVEPIQIEAGVRLLPRAYLEALCAETARAGALLVADEIQTGLGRTGRFLASEDWPRRPDLVVLGKALGGGLVPLSAMLTRRELFADAYGTHERAEAHNSTFSGNALACVAGLAALDLLDEPLLARAAAAGARFRAALADALGDLPLVRAVRGEGLLAGIELEAATHPFLTFGYLGLEELEGKPAVGFLLGHRLFKAGYITAVCGHDWGTVRVQPALTISDERLDAFVAACRRELEALCALA